MGKRKKSIRVPDYQCDLLQHLYLEFGIPSDQYKRRPKERAQFTTRWNDLSERNDSPEDLLHFIVTRRKNKQWVTFGGTHKRLESMPDDFLSRKEWKQLEMAFVNVVSSKGKGSDNLVFDTNLSKELAKAFALLSGRIINAGLLTAAIEAKRKRGEWVTLPKNADRGFDDFDQAAAM